jgi:hypothetical protein
MNEIIRSGRTSLDYELAMSVTCQPIENYAAPI